MLEWRDHILAGFATTQRFSGILFALSYGFILFGFIEFLILGLRNGKISREAWRDYGIGLPHELINLTVGYAIIAGILLKLEKFRIFEIPMTALTWVLAILVADFISYWYHRLEHSSRFFWAHHRIHHSSSELSVNTSLRLAWHECLIFWIYVIPMLVMGFGAIQALVAFKMVVVYHFWVHNRHVGTLGPLEYILITPSSHRVHHGTNPEYVDRNFGVMLSVWDRLFGTYTPEIATVQYGLPGEMNAPSILSLNFGEYGRIIKDLRRAQGVNKKLSAILGPPLQSQASECRKARCISPAV